MASNRRGGSSTSGGGGTGKRAGKSDWNPCLWILIIPAGVVVGIVAGTQIIPM